MEIFIISILILLNGFFALSEIALVSSKKYRLEQFKADKHKGAKIALKLLDDSESFLSAIQVGITLIGIITGVYGGINIADDLAPIIQKIEILKDSSYEIALTITVVIITYFSIVIGELVPKTVALSNPEKISVIIAWPVYIFSILFYPFVKFLSFSTTLINSFLRIKKQPDTLTEAEIRQILKSATKHGVIEKEQNLIHNRVFYFSDKKARNIMTNRMEVEWIDLGQPYINIKEDIIKSNHSRLICCQNSLDEFIGILKVKDFLSELAIQDKVTITDLLTQPLIIPENADAPKVLNIFKEKQNHFSIIVNEYGSLEGIITLHDILENLIGEISEEDEVTEPDVFLRDDQSFLVSGDAPVEVLDGIFANYMTDYEHIDFTTVAGFVLHHIEKIPQIGDKFTFNDYLIEIVDIDGMRIDKILIRKK